MLRGPSAVVILLISSITSITSILATATQLPAARRLKLVVELPEGLPAGLLLPLPARVKGRAAPGAVLLAQHDAFGPKPVLVQCEPRDRSDRLGNEQESIGMLHHELPEILREVCDQNDT